MTSVVVYWPIPFLTELPFIRTRRSSRQRRINSCFRLRQPIANFLPIDDSDRKLLKTQASERTFALETSCEFNFFRSRTRSRLCLKREETRITRCMTLRNYQYQRDVSLDTNKHSFQDLCVDSCLLIFECVSRFIAADKENQWYMGKICSLSRVRCNISDYMWLLELVINYWKLLVSLVQCKRGIYKFSVGVSETLLLQVEQAVIRRTISATSSQPSKFSVTNY